MLFGRFCSASRSPGSCASTGPGSCSSPRRLPWCVPSLSRFSPISFLSCMRAARKLAHGAPKPFVRRRPVALPFPSVSANRCGHTGPRPPLARTRCTWHCSCAASSSPTLLWGDGQAPRPPQTSASVSLGCPRRFRFFVLVKTAALRRRGPVSPCLTEPRCCANAHAPRAALIVGSVVWVTLLQRPGAEGAASRRASSASAGAAQDGGTDSAADDCR